MLNFKFLIDALINAVSYHYQVGGYWCKVNVQTFSRSAFVSWYQVDQKNFLKWFDTIKDDEGKHIAYCLHKHREMVLTTTILSVHHKCRLQLNFILAV